MAHHRYRLLWVAIAYRRHGGPGALLHLAQALAAGHRHVGEPIGEPAAQELRVALPHLSEADPLHLAHVHLDQPGLDLHRVTQRIGQGGGRGDGALQGAGVDGAYRPEGGGVGQPCGQRLGLEAAKLVQRNVLLAES